MTSRVRKRSRSQVAWGIVGFLSIHIVVLLGMELSRPEAFDKESQVRRSLINARRAENPNADLLLMVGSSRVGHAFLPGELSPMTAPDGRSVLPFNFSHLAAGPRTNLMRVQRLLRDGIIPRWIIIESIPGGLTHEGTPANQACFADLPTLCRHADPANVLLLYGRERLNVLHKHRRFLVEEMAPPFVTYGEYSDAVTLEPLGDDLHWIRRDEYPPAKRELLTRQAEEIYRPRMANWTIDAELDDATRDLLAVCRDNGIAVAVVLTPEDSRFRKWYSAETTAQVTEYYARLARETGVPVIDTRDWVADDGFFDPHHMTLAGAQAYTRRLESDVIQPLVNGTILSPAARR